MNEPITRHVGSVYRDCQYRARLAALKTADCSAPDSLTDDCDDEGGTVYDPGEVEDDLR